MSKPLRLVLTEEQSACIRESGITFAVMGPGSYPGATGRAVLYLFECTQDGARGACEVAMGESTARRIRHATTPATPADGSDTRPTCRKATTATTGASLPPSRHP
jgi:hypothetical protein